MDDFRVGMGAVLSQQGHPLSFFRKPFIPKLLRALMYVWGLFAITTKVNKWSQYLLGHRFAIITNHLSLKELLTQVIQTSEQHTYLARLMGYDCQIQYRSGIHNQAANALSRFPKQDPSLSMILFVPSLTFLEELRRQLDNHPEYTRHCQDVLNNPAKHPQYLGDFW